MQPRSETEVFNLWSVDPRGSVKSFQGVRGQTLEKLETRGHILTKQKYWPYQCCRYSLRHTELKTSLVFAMLCRLGMQS